MCPPPAPKAGGGHTRLAVRGWEVNILEDARHWIGLLQYNPSTVLVLSMGLDSLRPGRLHNISWGLEVFKFYIHLIKEEVLDYLGQGLAKNFFRV